MQSVEASEAEVSVSRVLRTCEWDAAEYEFADASKLRVRSRCFLGENEFFEPYASFRYGFRNLGDDEAVVTENLASVREDLRKAWKRILLADVVFCNTDRHMRNFGVIRSAVTGEVLRLAPNFDNNQAYRANPGGYSDRMLRSYMLAADREDRENLGVLYEAVKRCGVLNEAGEAIRRMIGA